MNIALRALGAVLLAALAGCGNKDQRASVSGKVTVAGKGPLTGGTITFVAADNPSRTASGTVKADGSYAVTDAPVGPCKVVVSNAHLDPSAGKGGQPGMGKGMGGMKGMPGAGPPAGLGGPKEGDKAKMKAGPPAGADAPAEMNEGKADQGGQKFVRIDAAFGSPDSTTLTFEVKPGENSHNVDVK